MTHHDQAVNRMDWDQETNAFSYPNGKDCSSKVCHSEGFYKARGMTSPARMTLSSSRVTT